MLQTDKTESDATCDKSAISDKLSKEMILSRLIHTTYLTVNIEHNLKCCSFYRRADHLILYTANIS